MRSLRLDGLSWQEAEQALRAESLVVVPLGADCKEHGPHLPLGNDRLLADTVAARLCEREEIVLAPTIGLSFYPAFVDYPGSISLGQQTARDVIVDVARALARHGPRRIYVWNTGLSTKRPLRGAQEILADEGVLVHFTDLEAALAPAVARIAEQSGGSHADEMETSLMLALAPESVRLERAVKDHHPRTPGQRFSRVDDGSGTYSPTGTWGDPTLATREKGEALLAQLLAHLHEDLEALRAAQLPPAPAPREMSS
jgi:creatinine amidohydrolase